MVFKLKRCKHKVVDKYSKKVRVCKNKTDGEYCHIHNEIENFQEGLCCFCGEECNPCSQACGRCARALSWMK